MSSVARRIACAAWWLSYATALVVVVAWLGGCVSPKSMYGNVYECPQSLIERLEQRLDADKEDKR